MAKTSVFKNATWIIGCKIIQSILSLVVGMLSARYLGPSGYGLINYAASVVTFVVPIMQLGLNLTLVQELVTNPDKEGEIMGTAIAMNFVSSFFSIGCVTVFVFLANTGERETLIVCFLYSLLLVAQSVEIIQYWFQAKLKSKYVSITSLIAYVIVSAYKLYLLITNKSIYWFAISQALDFLIIAVALLFIYKKVGGQKLRFSFGRVKKLFSRSKFYIVSSMMVTIFASTDKVMLKIMCSDAVAGYYSAAVTTASIASFVFGAIIDSARPSILESKKIGDKNYGKKISSLYSVIIYLSLAQSVFMTLLASPLITLMFGGDFSPAIDTLRIIVWYTTFAYLGSVRNVWILAEQKQKYLWILNLSGAVTNIILNYFFIGLWGANGAALASLITQIFTNVIMNIIIKPYRPVNKYFFCGCNPKLLFDMIKGFVKKKNKPANVELSEDSDNIDVNSIKNYQIVDKNIIKEEVEKNERN